jgi:hypothetical protein
MLNYLTVLLILRVKSFNAKDEKTQGKSKGQKNSLKLLTKKQLHPADEIYT